MQVIDRNGRLKVEITNAVEELTVGVTTISGGVSGRALYDNAGILGELNLSSIYVPQTRTLTINGTTQDLSADRTFTISTGITIGTTAITSGTVGRVLFEGTGNVVQESANLFWDNTNNRLGIGTSSPSATLHLNTTTSVYNCRIQSQSSSGAGLIGTEYYWDATQLATFSVNGPSGEFKWFLKSGYFSTFYSNALERMRIFTTGNVGINTTTDAGFKLDVNGTARFVGNVSLGSPNINDKLEVYGNILVRANDRIRLAGTSDGNTALWANSGSSAQMNVKNGSGSAFDITFGSIGSTTRMLRIHSYDSTTPSVVVGNNATAFASSVLTVESTTQGFLPPRMTTTQKNAIASPAAGLVVYDTTLSKLCVYTTTWETITSL